MAYADYNYYAFSFAGATVPAGEFTPLAAKASRYIDYVTDNRINNVTDKVRNACCAAVDAAYELNQANVNLNPGVKSENTDGYSVTYADVDIAQLQVQEEQVMYNAIRRELSGTGLLYRGC